MTNHPILLMHAAGDTYYADLDREPTLDMIVETIEEWIRAGDWGDDGASVGVRWGIMADGEEIDYGWHTVDIEQDHASGIREAMGSAGCGLDPSDHDWTSEGEGGCDENPGVWSRGGTTMVYRSHCRVCGLRREEVHHGAQRNPGQCDSVLYMAPDIDDDDDDDDDDNDDDNK